MLGLMRENGPDDEFDLVEPIVSLPLSTRAWSPGLGFCCILSTLLQCLYESIVLVEPGTKVTSVRDGLGTCEQEKIVAFDVLQLLTPKSYYVPTC